MPDLELDDELRRRFGAAMSLAHHDRTLLEASQLQAEQARTGAHSRLRLKGRALESLGKLKGSPRRGSIGVNRPRLVPSLRNLGVLWLVVLLAGAGALVYSQLPSHSTSTTPLSHTRSSTPATVTPLPKFEACAYGPPKNSMPPRVPPSTEPAGFQYNCGAAHPYSWLQDVTWATWGATSATGKGELTVNTCTPDCAAGNLENRPISIELSHPARLDGFLLFTRMDITFEGANPSKPLHVSVPGPCPSYGGVGC